jgi:hypothetical protein
MLKSLFDFLAFSGSSEEENSLLSDWLRRIFLISVVILVCYALTGFFRRLTFEIYLFIGLYLIFFAGLNGIRAFGWLAILLQRNSGVAGCGLEFWRGAQRQL